MLGLSLLLLISGTEGRTDGPYVSLATSEAIDIARSAARTWEGRGYSERRATFDVANPALDKLGGYVTVLYNRGDQPVLSVSINLSTGQVVDRTRCLYFDGSYFRKLRSRFSALTGVGPVPRGSLATMIGCEALKPSSR